MKEVTKHYANEDITVVWKPSKCIHAAICVKKLPEVYKPKEKPWINLGDTSTEKLIDQINACPSGALSYIVNQAKEDDPGNTSTTTTVEVMPNGPLIMDGEISLTLSDQSTERKSGKTALCRCGASANKLFCDGKPLAVNFQG